LERLIRSQEIAPGESLSENRAAEILGVSKGTARVALMKLESKGLLSKGNRGRSGGRRVVNKEVFEDEDSEIFLERLEMRDALLSEAAYLAAHHMNAWQAKEFQDLVEDEWEGDDHDKRFKACCDYLFQHCGNRLLQKMWKQLRLAAFVVRDPEILRQVEDVMKEDGPNTRGLVPDVAQLIIRRDGVGAQRAMHEYHQRMIHGYRAAAARADRENLTDSPSREEDRA